MHMQIVALLIFALVTLSLAKKTISIQTSNADPTHLISRNEAYLRNLPERQLERLLECLGPEKLSTVTSDTELVGVIQKNIAFTRANTFRILYSLIPMLILYLSQETSAHSMKLFLFRLAFAMLQWLFRLTNYLNHRIHKPPDMLLHYTDFVATLYRQFVLFQEWYSVEQIPQNDDIPYAQLICTWEIIPTLIIFIQALMDAEW